MEEQRGWREQMERQMWELVADNPIIRLMVAAPLLLAACKKVASWPSGVDPELVSDCEAAIALAEGQS